MSHAKLIWISWLAIACITLISYTSVQAYTYFTTTTIEDVRKQNDAFEKAKGELLKARVEYCNDTSTGKIDYDSCGEFLNKSLNTWTHSTGSTVLPPKWLTKLVVKDVKTSGELKSKAIYGDAHLQLVNTVKNAEVWTSGFWKTYDLAVPLIQKYEWLHLKAYHDYKWCSIGWGTRAKSCKEVITQAEADKRLWNIVKQVISRVQKDFPTLSSKQQAWLVSFAYNCHSGYRDVVKNWLWQHKFWCRTAWGERLQGLVNRRLEEQTLIFN